MAGPCTAEGAGSIVAMSALRAQHEEIARVRGEALAEAIREPMLAVVRRAQQAHAMIAGPQRIVQALHVFGMHGVEQRTGRNLAGLRQRGARALAHARALRGIRFERLDENEAVVMLREMAQQAMGFVHGAARERAFVVVAQQHFVARLRNRRDQLRAALLASQTLDQGNHDERDERIGHDQNEIVAIEIRNIAVRRHEQIIGDTETEHHHGQRRREAQIVFDQRGGDAKRGCGHDRAEHRMQGNAQGGRDGERAGCEAPTAWTSGCPKTGITDFHGMQWRQPRSVPAIGLRRTLARWFYRIRKRVGRVCEDSAGQPVRRIVI
ncbi:hypothetical protein PT2222_350032 [Paraburkholderia tropica]